MTGYQMVKMNHIVYCQSESNYTRIFVINEPDILVTKTLRLISDILSADMFFRIHKSHLVNLNFIKQYVNVGGHYIILDDGTRLDVAFRRVDEFVQVLTGKTNNHKE